MVYSYAANLATKRDIAGLHLEVPGHLLGLFKTLEQYGRQLKTERGPTVKWHIKYDDRELSMFLNVKLSEADSWSKVDYNTAREEVRKTEATETASFRDRLLSSTSSGGGDVEEIEIMETESLPKSATLQKFKNTNGTRWGDKK